MEEGRAQIIPLIRSPPTPQQGDNSTSLRADPFFSSTPQGQVWINGFNLGRYWTKRGPQQTLYVPRPLLFPRGAHNRITLLELENVPPQPQIQFLDRPILNSTKHRTYVYSLSSASEPMELSGH